ncbi:hypothetical protein [Variovorax sp. dw_954]|uniref:hypothetical protein n=1 Tax=Variovorax sp. dw_954 TaxID=2720078 RepID=UPI001BD54778|nr:hypothetical protein [Variovorax sp. dw_954]
MTSSLYDLLPAVHRMRDARIALSADLLTAAEKATLGALQLLNPAPGTPQQFQLDGLLAKAARGPLKSLLMVIDEQLAAMAEDLDQLYDDQFIETCAEWVIPYIGDLVGYIPIHGIAAAVDNTRAAVASTIALRRRKGTLRVIEELAHDLTGWGSHAREMFELLGATQYVRHLRRHCRYAPDVRDWRTCLYVDTGFDRCMHRVDVRSVARGRARFNVPNIAIFLWTQAAYRVTAAPAAASAKNLAGAPRCFRFSSLGIDTPLFHRARALPPGGLDPVQAANVADRLRRRVLCEDLKAGVGAGYYRPTGSLSVWLDGRLVDPFEIRVANLSGPDGAWSNLPGPASAAQPYALVIDPELGRLALPDPGAAPVPVVTATWHYGFAADLGGGEYERASSFIQTDPVWVLPYPDTAQPARYATLAQALAFAVVQLALNGTVALEITGSATLASPALAVDLPAGTTLELRAADGARPTLLLAGQIDVSGDVSSTLAINGLLIAADTGMAPGAPAPAAMLHVPALRPGGGVNALARLQLTHTTLVPGWAVDTTPSSCAQPRFPGAPALLVEAPGCQVEGHGAILGAILAVPLADVTLVDCIVDACDRSGVAHAAPDGQSAGASLAMNGCTVVGKVHASALCLVSDSIFWSALASIDSWSSGLVADRKQEGCVRFSFVPVGARLPRHYECVQQVLAGPEPLFASRRYGTPDYLKLLVSTDDVIRRGASDGGEMGAFHALLAPLRESDLAIRMREYLPVGLQSGAIVEN